MHAVDRDQHHVSDRLTVTVVTGVSRGVPTRGGHRYGNSQGTGRGRGEGAPLEASTHILDSVFEELPGYMEARIGQRCRGVNVV
jgi:hypothetical protein